MITWRIDLLGGFVLRRNGQQLHLPNRKDRLVLAYLAMHEGRAVPRERLSGLLWANRGEEQARASLRQSLAALRDAFADGEEGMPLESNRETVMLHQTPSLSVDLWEFLRHSSSTGSTDLALSAYCGPLLHGIDAPTPEFDQWLTPERARLEDTAASVISRLAAGPLSPEQNRLVLTRARELLVRDRLREPLYQAAMRIYMREQKWAECAVLYKECCAALEEDLGVGPSEDTIALFRELPAPQQAPVEPAKPEPVSREERPSIAVMPFQNIAGSADLAILCEGLAEDITSGLGRFRLLTVIDRHSAREVAGLTSDAKEIGSRLGVDLVLQGSVQRRPNGFRLHVRLVEAETRAQRWAGEFAVTEEEVLTAPDRIMAAVLPSINAQIETSLLLRSRRKTSLAAYEHLLLGVRHLRGYQPEDNEKAIAHFDEALALDQEFALALAYRGFAEIVVHGYDATPQPVLEGAIRKIKEANRLDPEEPRIWWLLGLAVSYTGDRLAEERFYRRAAELNPNDANILAVLALATVSRGQREEGLAMFREAFRLNPYHPEWYWMDYGSALYLSERYEEALDAFRRRTEHGVWVLCRIAACLAQLGRQEEAQNVASEILVRSPGFRLSALRTGSWGPEDSRRFRDGMLKAGLPP